MKQYTTLGATYAAAIEIATDVLGGNFDAEFRVGDGAGVTCTRKSCGITHGVEILIGGRAEDCTQAFYHIEPDVREIRATE